MTRDYATDLVFRGCQHPINRCSADAKRGCNGASGFTGGVHALDESSVRLVEHLGSPYRLSPCPPGFACSCPTFTAKFQLQLGQARENARDHAAVVFDVSIPSRNDRRTMLRSPSSRIVVITYAAFLPSRSIPTRTMESPGRA